MTKRWTNQYAVEMRLEFLTTVIVEADTPIEATEAAERAEFLDDGMRGAELVNWEIVGKPKLDQ